VHIYDGARYDVLIFTLAGMLRASDSRRRGVRTGVSAAQSHGGH